jgi:hypothetical protein
MSVSPHPSRSALQTGDAVSRALPKSNSNMSADTERTEREGGPTLVRVNEEPSTDVPIWDGIPPLSMQQLWFSLQRLQWSSLLILPASPESSAMDFGRPLYQVARLAMGPRVRLLDGRGVKLTRTAPLILDMTGASSDRGAASEGDRVLVLLESVISHPSGVPVALAADAAVLCVDLGKTTLAHAKETLRLVGAQRFVGCLTTSPARRPKK